MLAWRNVPLVLWQRMPLFGRVLSTKCKMFSRGLIYSFLNLVSRMGTSLSLSQSGWFCKGLEQGLAFASSVSSLKLK